MAISLYSSRTMLRGLDQQKRPLGFISNVVFSETDTFGTEEVDLDIRKGKRRVAPFVRPTVASKLVERIGYTTRKYKPAYCKPKMATTSADILKRPFSQHPYITTPTPVQAAARRLGEELQELWEMVIRRMESMCAEAMFTGQVQIVGDGINETIDYLMPASHQIVLAGVNLWTDNASNPINDIRDWKRLGRQDSGLPMTDIIMGHDVAKAFLNNPNVQAILDNRRIVEVAEIMRMERPDMGETVELIARVENINIWSYDEWYIDPVTDLEVPMVPENKLVMFSSRMRASKLWGAIQDESALVPTERFPTSWRENDPPRRLIMLQSAPLPGMHQPDAIINVQAVA